MFEVLVLSTVLAVAMAAFVSWILVRRERKARAKREEAIRALKEQSDREWAAIRAKVKRVPAAPTTASVKASYVAPVQTPPGSGIDLTTIALLPSTSPTHHNTRSDDDTPSRSSSSWSSSYSDSYSSSSSDSPSSDW